jgi:geranylgeranylglycerol-phosphate geranylgeranyltransferase
VHFYSAFIVALLLWLYSFRLKGTMLAGNIAVAGFLGYTIVYGGLISRNWKAALVPAAFAFLINLAREIIKDTADRRGDAQSGIRTFPVQYGEKAALRLSVFCLTVLVLATFAPYLCGLYNRLYLIIILAGVNAPLAVMAIILLKKSPGEAALNRISGLLKLLMAAGMAAIILGKAGPACAYAFSV